MPVNQVIIMDNLLRHKDGLGPHTGWLHCLFDYLIGSISSTPVNAANGTDATDFHHKIYAALGHETVYNHSWIDIHHNRNNDASLALIREMFQDTFVIAMELPPLLQAGFDTLGIPYIKMVNHPIRYMDDIFFGFASNQKTVFDRLKRYETERSVFYQEASFLKAEMSVREFGMPYMVIPNSAVFFGQTQMDYSLIQDNQVLSLLDYKDRFAEITRQHQHVYFKPHPYDRSDEIITFVKSFKNVTVIEPQAISTYDLLSSKNVQKCYAISSGVLYEASYMGKDVEYFYQQPFVFTHDHAPEAVFDFKETYVPVFKAFWQPAFWADIMSGYIPVDKHVPVRNPSPFTNKLRRIMNATWGYDDNQSMSVKSRFYLLDVQINTLYKELQRMRQFSLRGLIFAILNRVDKGFDK